MGKGRSLKVIGGLKGRWEFVWGEVVKTYGAGRTGGLGVR